MAKKIDMNEEIEIFVQNSRLSKKIFEPEWNLNMSYLLGDQWVRASKTSAQIVRSDNSSARRYVVNYIAPAVETITAKVSAPNPILKAIPRSGSTDDKYAARVAEYVAMSEIWEGFNMQTQLLRIIPIMATCGSVILTPYFNPNAGNLISADEINSKAGEIIIEKDMREGKLECDFLTPFEAHYSVHADTDEDSEAFCVEKARTLNWVYENYGVDAEPSKDIAFSDVFERFKRLMNGTAENKNTDMVKVRTYYKKPCKNFPRGYMTVRTDTGRILFEDDKLPWGLDKFGTIPQVKIDYKSTLGSFWNKGVISQVRSSQKQINKTYSMYMDYINKVTFFAILNPQGNGVKKEHIDLSKPANFVNYLPMADNGGRPQFMETPAFNPQILDNIRMNKQHIDDVLGVHEISRATAPAGIKTGRALSILDAADDTKIHPLVVNIENGISRMASIGLQIIENTYDIPRMIRMVGKTNARMVKNFKGDKLKGNTDVKIKLRTPLPMNKMAAMDTVITLWREQLIPHTEEGLKIAHNMIEMESYNVILETTKDEEQADYENSILDEGALGQIAVNPETGEELYDEQGNPVYMGMPRNPWDNDELHLKSHTSRQKEIQYFDAIEENPQVNMAYELHIKNHQEALLKKNELAMQDQKNAQKEQLLWQTEIQKAKQEIDTYFKAQLEEIKGEIEKEKIVLEAELQNKTGMDIQGQI